MAWGCVGTQTALSTTARETHRLPSATQCWLLQQAFLLPDRAGKVNQPGVLQGSFQLQRLRVFSVYNLVVARN